MKTALVAGASGLTGVYLTELLLKSPNYDLVKVLVRRPLGKEHPSLQQIVFDYENPDIDAIKTDHVYCALGTTIKKAGSRDEFKKVDFHYPLHLARLSYDSGAERFAIVSAIGAKRNSLFFYNKVKGQMEEAIKDLPFHSVFIARPSMLLGPRDESRLGEEIGKKVMTTLRFLLPSNYKPVHASQVAAAMIDSMNSRKKGFHVITSAKMQKYPVMK
jgi:uncharacterized protein YbjT (DUF2867 family)